MLIVDAHLDLAYNALRGRDVLRPAIEQTPDSEGIPTVGLPDLHAGGVGLVCGTIFCAPSSDGVAADGYRSPQEARDAGWAQFTWYRQQAVAGKIRFVLRRSDLPADHSSTGGPLPLIVLLEGADPLRTPDDVAEWHAHGLRAIGLAWKRTRYAGGTGAPGPLTPEGVALVKELDRFGIIQDASHLAEASFWQLLDLTTSPVMASHSNCRAFVPTDRQLSDQMIKAIIARDGVIGINFFDKFLLEPKEYKTRRANLNDVVRHIRRICDLAGNTLHVSIGTDMDGGLGREEIPQEIKTSADLPRIADALSAAGFDDPSVQGIMGGNWLRFFSGALPQ